MPVLMNKGNDPRQAAWLFYTDSTALDELGSAAYDGRYDSGVLEVDEADLAAAKKASAEVPVYLAVRELVPQDYDLEQIEQALKEAEAAAREAAEQGADEPAACDDAGDAGQQGVSDEAASEGEGEGAEAPYEPVPAPEGLRVRVGTTTAAAARAFIAPAAGAQEDDGVWDAALPGLQMLVSLIRYMREHNALSPFVVWHIDAQGILRMAPAKQVKPMAGNILKVKL